MNEEEIWQQLEAKLKRKEEQNLVAIMVERFVESADLSTMTLREAFELGFKQGRM